MTRLAAAAAVSAATVTTTLVAFSPNAFAAAGATLTPNTGLVDGQKPAVAGSGFDASRTIQIEECQGTVAAPPLDSTTCDGLTNQAQVHTDVSGNIITPATYTVHLVNATDGNTTFVSDGSGVVCDSKTSCVAYIGEDPGNFATAHTFVNLSFAPPPGQAKPPVLATPKAVSVVAGGSVNGDITVGATGNTGTVACGFPCDSNGTAETIDANTPTTPSVAPTHGTVTISANGTFVYQETDAALNSTGGTDTFTVGTAPGPGGPTATRTGDSPATSTPGNNVVVNVTISAAATHAQSCDTGPNNFVGGVQPNHQVPGGPTASQVGAQCSIDQILVVPLVSGDLSMSEPTTPLLGAPVLGGLETLLNGTVVSGGTTCTSAVPTLNGQPILACGNLQPVTVMNNRGTDNSWSLTGRVTDFLDPVLGQSPGATGSKTCDTPATFSNHCIPGGNLGWAPTAAVGQDIVPGDVAQVTAGPVVPGPIAGTAFYLAATANSGVLGGTKSQPAAASGKTTTPNAPTPPGGLQGATQPLCNTASTTSGGQFVCGASLVVVVPASAAKPASPGYEAVLTLTLLSQ